MKIKLLSTLVLFSSQISFSQTIKGKITSNNYTIPKVEVINVNSKTLSVSDANGYFSIDSKMNDTIVFIAKNYELKKIVINPLIINDTDLNIGLILKAEELKEVVVHQVNIDWKLDKKWEKEKNHEIAMQKKAKALKNSGVYNGTIENGMDFVKIGKMIFGGLFKGDKKSKPEIDFKEVATTNLDQKFYTETLKLKKEEIEPFLVFCNFDPKSKEILSENSNALILMDFLYQKNTEFKKLHATE